MPDTKIIVNNDGSLKVEGDFTVYDVEGNAFDLAGPKNHLVLPLRAFREQALLRW